MPKARSSTIPNFSQQLFDTDHVGPTLGATYYVGSKELNLQLAKIHMASTISCGLGVHFDYVRENLEHLKNCCPKAEVVAGEIGQLIKLIIPLKWMIRNNRIDITQILNLIYGDFFGERQIDRVRLLDLDFSAEALDFFKGPSFGIEKIRDSLNTSRDQRPHIAVVPHPPLGMTAEKYARQCHELILAGADHIVDSDVLVDPSHCPLTDRVTLVADCIDKAASNGIRAMYSVNITSDVDRLLENADLVSSQSGSIALGVCVANTGLSALRILLEHMEKKRSFPIHVHITGLPLMSRYSKFGISYRAFNTLVRLLGADIVHTGSLTGRYALVQEEHNQSDQKPALDTLWNNETLTNKEYGNKSEEIKTVFPLIAGGINPSNVEYHLRLLGNDVILLAGAGLFRESFGNLKAVKSVVGALRQAIDIVMSDESVFSVVSQASTGLKRKKEFPELVSYYERHLDEFKQWDWKTKSKGLRALDKLSKVLPR